MSNPVNGIGRLVPGLIEQAGKSPASQSAKPVASDGNFKDLLANLLDGVNDIQMESADIQQALMNGEPVELHQVMIKAQEAGLSMDLLLEIRNKLVNAYNEIMQMPL